ncbi:MAG TPA: hypothetical protein VJJ23_01955 [Candidatus Nanoarchaeia archaeon]|nr:hypothetical protein [Candidatus Nanoarchaeia archaeon]
MVNKYFIIVIEVIAIIAGLYAIFKLIKNVDIAFGALAITFGVLSIIWTSMALSNLAPGSSLRKQTLLYLLSLIVIVIASGINIVNILIKSIGLRYVYYIFISLAFLIFTFTSYKVLKTGKEFGFKEKADEIRKKLKQKGAK